MKKNSDDTTILEKVKKRSWVPNPQEHFGEENVKPGDNSRYLRYALASLDLPPIDISDPDQVEKRIYDYFQFCVENDRKPNMVGMANWIAIDLHNFENETTLIVPTNTVTTDYSIDLK